MRIFKRNGYWWVDIRGYGVERQRLRLSKWKRVAQEVADEIEAKIVRQEWVGPVNSKITFKEFSQKYLSTYASTSLRPSSYNRCQDIVNRILIPKFGGMKLSKIHPEDVEACRYPRLYRRGTFLKFKLRLSCVFLLLALNVFPDNRLVYSYRRDEKSF